MSQIEPTTPRITPAQLPLLACFFFLCGLVLFISLGSIPLSGRSEGRYASTSMAMADNNQWLVPQFMGKPHLTKPPLTYWLQAACLKTFGHGEFAVRFPSALAGALTVLLVFLIGRRIGGTITGFTAAGTLAVMPLHVVINRLTLTDGLLGFFWFAALAAGYLAIKEPGKKRWPLLMWAAVALGMLTKAHLALVPVGMILLWLGLGRRWKEKSALKLAWGLPLACMPLAIWVAAIIFKFPDATSIWWHEIVERLLGHGVKTEVADTSLHYKSPLYFIPIFIGGMIPATAMLMLPGVNLSWKSAWAKIRAGEDAALWALSVAVPFLIFSINKGKLASYILPLGPPLALLTGAMLAGWLEGKYDQPVIGRDAAGNRPTKPAEVRGALLVISLLAAVIVAGLIWLPMPTVERGVAKATAVFERFSGTFASPPSARRIAAATQRAAAATQADNADADPASALAPQAASDTSTALNALTILRQMPGLPVIPLLAAVSAIWLFIVWGSVKNPRPVPMLRRALPLACLWVMTVFGWVGALQVYRLLGSLANNSQMIAEIDLHTNFPKPQMVTFGFRDATLTFYLRKVVPFKGTADELDEWINAYPNDAVIVMESDAWTLWAPKHPDVANKLKEVMRWKQLPSPSERVVFVPKPGLLTTTRPAGTPAADLPEDDTGG